MTVGPPAAPRVVIVDDTTGLPIFGSGSGVGGTGTAGTVNTTITGSTIAIPVDVQALYRTQAIFTNTVLAANAVYTGVLVDGLNFRRITGKAFSDVAGSLAIQQSEDGATWDTITTIAVVAATPVVWDQVINSRYVRYVYTNGGTIQTAFRLSGYLAAA